MSKLELFIAAWLTRRIVQQGDHARKIRQLYSMLRKQAEIQFTEDSEPTLSTFLRERFDEAMNLPEEVASE